MPDPMTWGVLAAQTATWSVKKLASLGAGTAWKEKIEPAFKRSGLDHELAGAYEAAFKGFVDVLRGPFVIDDAMDARLREMFADDGFKEILAELPRARFQDVEVDRARALFAGLGLPGASDAYFEVVDYFAKIGADDSQTRAAFVARLGDEDLSVRLSAVDYFAKIGADDSQTRAAFVARLGDEDFRVRAQAVSFFVETGLRDRAGAVFDAFVAGGSAHTATETDQKLSAEIGRFAAEDDALLKRITGKRIQHFDRSRALAATAARRDEIRRASTPLADVIAGTATP